MDENPRLDLLFEKINRDKTERTLGKVELFALRSFTFAVLIVVIVAWSVIGFIFWIPLLTRSIAVFSSMVLISTITEENPSVYGYQLHFAIIFYTIGYRSIIETIYNKGKPTKYNLGKMDVPWKQVFIEVTWTIIFWLIILYGFGVFNWVPAYLKLVL